LTGSVLFTGSGRAQPGAHTLAAATITTYETHRRSSVSTKAAPRLSTGFHHAASGVLAAYAFATGGSSRSHGQMDIVLTLPLLFLITVIFISESFKYARMNGGG
jgi:hypothetical protein